MSKRWPYEKRMPLAKIRIDANTTIEKAAVALGITSRTLSRYENGENDISMKTAEKMSVLYNIPFETIRQAVKDTWSLHN